MLRTAPGWAWLWLLTIVSFTVFGIRVAAIVRRLRQAHPERRWDEPARRLRLVAANVLGQRRMFEEPVIGAAHLIIFWSFVVFAASFAWDLAAGLLPFLKLPFAAEMPAAAVALKVAAVVGLAALAVAAFRRYLFTPPRLERSRDATVILLLIAVVLLTSLAGAWWAHMITVLGFLAYLPYSKHLHLLASPFGVFFANLRPMTLPDGRTGDGFTWRELFNGLACAECGRCDRACPSVASGNALSPKQLMHALKMHVRGAELDVTPAELWACATCGACVHRCPVFNDHLAVVLELRRRLVAKGEVDERLKTALMNLGRYGNSFGQSPRNRAKWAQAAGFKIKDARKEPVEYLLYPGDYAAYDPRGQAAAIAAARLLARASVSFGILYEAEQNAGNDVRRVGEEGLFEVLREKNLAALGKAKFERIVTGDPHTYHALKNEYGRADGVVHYAELIAGLNLPVTDTRPLAVTYHDPCYLGRYNGLYDAPRQALAKLGVELKEMPRHRDRALCCGAGGGRIWMEDAAQPGERPAESRVREAAASGAGTLVVACPKDYVMFEDALKTAGLQDRLAVKDLVQLAEERSRPHA